MSILVGIVMLLLGIGMLIASRRLAGALNHELPRDAMLLTALATTAVLAWTRIAWRRGFPLKLVGRDSLLDHLIGWGSSLALALLAIGCCYPANQTSDWLIWLPLLIADQFWRQNFYDAGQPTARPGAVCDPEQRSGGQALFPGIETSDRAEHEAIVQQLFRVRDDHAHEVIYGTLRADFQTGQRTAVVHVGFCPPLEYLPEIEAESLPGQPTRIKVVQALSHGVRLDVRLPTEAEENCHVWVDMAARPFSPKQPDVISA
ncbi:MAG: hypothetical protein MI725_16125 [Pirellulales bacterium]|nr:hypothetical protein [Pirellulales bacterium]